MVEKPRANVRNAWVRGVAGALLLLAGLSGTVQAATLAVPNASFEAPTAPNPYAPPYVELRVDAWQKTPKPFWWDEVAYGPWDQLVGIFANTPPGDPSRINNCDGNQAMYIFNNPGVGVFQDYDSIDWSNTVPTHAFSEVFEAGKTYELMVGVATSFYRPPTNGASLELSLFYRDAQNTFVTVTSTTVTNNETVLPNPTQLKDFKVKLGPVKASDAWAGRKIGIAVTATGSMDLAGGVWNIDNVRLTSSAPVLSAPTLKNGEFSFTLLSEPGQRFEILGSATGAATSGWTSIRTLTNETGSVTFSEPATNTAGRLYRAQLVQ